MNRTVLMQAHALLAAFILPVAVMFITTGSLYTWGIQGSYFDEVHEITLSQPLRAEVSELTQLATSQLKSLNIQVPEGEPKLKKYGSHFLLEWTGSSKDVILEPSQNYSVAKLTVKDTSWYRTLVQLHKAKGGTAFKVYAVIFAVGIAILLISGFIMAWQTPKLRGPVIVSSLIGLFSFLVIVGLS